MKMTFQDKDAVCKGIQEIFSVSLFVLCLFFHAGMGWTKVY